MKQSASCKRVSLFLLAAVVSISSFFSLAPANAKDGLLFVLDSSGSMWGRVDKEPKIVIAKRVLSNLIEEMPSQLEGGLMVYGHRRKGDCEDIELVSALGSSKAEMLDKIASLNALGKTPISTALTQAGNLLSGREDITTLVLISDGVETCNGDPCSVAKALKAQGIKLILHVIGFDVDSKAAAQLSCIAEAGGGQYFQADSVEQLQGYLAQVQKSVVEKTVVPEPPPPPKVEKIEIKKSKSKTLRIAGPGTVVLKPAPWVQMPPEKWSLTDIENGSIRSIGNSSQLRVKAGEYQIRWRQSQHNHEEIQLTNIIKVEPGKTVEAPITTGVRITLPEGIGQPYWWGLIMPDEKTPFWKTRKIGAGQVVPAGSYQLYWHQKQHGSSPQKLKMISIEEDKLNDIVLNTGIVVQPAEWIKSKPYYYGLKDEKGTTIAKWQELKPQLIAAGVYQLVYRPTQHRHKTILWGEVTVSEEGFTTVNINSGLKFNHNPQAKPPYRIFLVNLDTKKVIEARETWEPLPVPPGRYRLDWRETQHGSSRQVLADEFVIEPETLVEVDL